MSEWRGFTVVREGEVDILVLNRPHRLNAIDPDMAADLSEYFRQLRSDRNCRVVIVRGAGDAFCAGVPCPVNPRPSARRSRPRMRAS